MTRGLALALSMLTGFSGLVYEVYWEKYLATLLGSHCEATAAVLGIFLIPQLGLVTVRMFMGLINLSAGVSFGLLGLRRDSQPLIDAGDATAPRSMVLRSTRSRPCSRVGCLATRDESTSTSTLLGHRPLFDIP